MPTTRTNYDILGVKPDATGDEIRLAYRAAARRLHPDANLHADADADAERKFAELSSAYATLADPLARQAYDRLLRSGKKPPKGSTSAGGSGHPGQAHYTWTNIATGQTPPGGAQSPGREDLNEMYNAFFGKSKKREDRS